MGQFSLFKSYLIIHIAVGENGVEVFNTSFGGIVVVMFQPFLDGTEIHRVFDNFVIVGNVELDSIYWGLKRPSELVLPHSLHDNFA